MTDTKRRISDSRETEAKTEPEARRQAWQSQQDDLLRRFQTFVQGELARRPRHSEGCRPTDRWFYEEIADVLPAFLSHEQSADDERRLCMAAYAIQLTLDIDHYIDAESIELGMPPNSGSVTSRLEAATGQSEVPFQHPWVFHLEYDKQGNPRVRDTDAPSTVR